MSPFLYVSCAATVKYSSWQWNREAAAVAHGDHGGSAGQRRTGNQHAAGAEP